MANEGRGEVFPRWSVYAIVGMFCFAAILISSYTLYWLISTLVQRHKLRTQQREEWESIVGEAETYATTLGCPLALVRATDFFDLGCMTHFEAIRDAHKLRVLDTIEKVTEFKRKFFIVFLSQQYLALTAPATNFMLFETMCAAARSAAAIANVSLDKIFLWVDFCSIPQDCRRVHICDAPLVVPLDQTLCCRLRCVLFLAGGVSHFCRPRVHFWSTATQGGLVSCNCSGSLQDTLADTHKPTSKR